MSSATLKTVEDQIASLEAFDGYMDEFEGKCEAAKKAFFVLLQDLKANGLSSSDPSYSQLERRFQLAALGTKKRIQEKMRSMDRSTLLHQRAAIKAEDQNPSDATQVDHLAASATDSMNRTKQALREEIDKSLLSYQIMERSTKRLQSSNQRQVELGGAGVLGRTRTAMRELWRRERADQFWITAAFGVFMAAAAYVVSQRVWMPPVWVLLQPLWNLIKERRAEPPNSTSAEGPTLTFSTEIAFTATTPSPDILLSYTDTKELYATTELKTVESEAEVTVHEQIDAVVSQANEAEPVHKTMMDVSSEARTSSTVESSSELSSLTTVVEEPKIATETAKVFVETQESPPSPALNNVVNEEAIVESPALLEETTEPLVEPEHAEENKAVIRSPEDVSEAVEETKAQLNPTPAPELDAVCANVDDVPVITTVDEQVSTNTAEVPEVAPTVDINDLTNTAEVPEVAPIAEIQDLPNTVEVSEMTPNIDEIEVGTIEPATLVSDPLIPSEETCPVQPEQENPHAQQEHENMGEEAFGEAGFSEIYEDTESHDISQLKSDSLLDDDPVEPGQHAEL